MNFEVLKLRGHILFVGILKKKQY